MFRIHHVVACYYFWFAPLLLLRSSDATSASSAPPAGSSSKQTPPSSHSISIRLPGRRYEDDDDDYLQRKRRSWAVGLGCEFDLFDTRGGQSQDSDASPQDQERSLDENSDDDKVTPSVQQAFNRQSAKTALARPVSQNKYFPSGGGGPGRGGGNKFNSKGPTMFSSVQEWWTANISPTVKNMPRINCKVEPTTTLKIRKTFRPLKTIVRLGADFNTQLGVWQFKSSWEDAIIGGKITLAGKELQISKSWQLSVGRYSSVWWWCRRFCYDF